MIRRPLTFAIVAALLGFVSVERPAAASPTAGFVLVNVATATYLDGGGSSHDALSNAVAVDVAAVSGATAHSGEACGAGAPSPFPIGPDAVMQFTIYNTSNVPDAYRITSVVATSGVVKSLAFVTGQGTQSAITGITTSPTVAPGGSIGISVTIGTVGIAMGSTTTVTLTARTTTGGTSNGLQTVTAADCGLAATGPVIGAPGPTQTGPPVKLVDGEPAVSAPTGATVSYSVAYMNHGGLAATGVVLSDPVPAGITPQPSTVTIDGRPAASAASLSGNTLSVALGTVAPGQAHTVAFNGVLTSAQAGISLVNVATFSATNAATVATSPASVLGGIADLVFDGAVGSSGPLAGATVTLMPSGGAQAVNLTGPPVSPNTNDANPFTTPPGGSYGLGLGVSQVGAGGYALLVSAPGYTSRRFAVTLTPDLNLTTYDATVAASDGAPIALPGSFALTHASSVTVPGVYGIFGNLPLFKPQSIVISKTVDRSQASGGDRLVYTIDVASAANALGQTSVVDRLPRDVLYAPGSALVDGVHVEPQVTGGSLTWTFPSLAAQHAIVFATAVAPGAVEGETLNNVATATAALPGVNVGTTSASASAITAVVGGILSDRSVILGRVFIDYFGDGRFRKGDLGVAKARIFLEDGESVQTDADGLFSFPSVRPGMHTLHLDPDSLPSALEPFAIRDFNDPRSPVRLVHGIFDGGLMSDVQFAVKVR